MAWSELHLPHIRNITVVRVCPDALLKQLPGPADVAAPKLHDAPCLQVVPSNDKFPALVFETVGCALGTNRLKDKARLRTAAGRLQLNQGCRSH